MGACAFKDLKGAQGVRGSGGAAETGGSKKPGSHHSCVKEFSFLPVAMPNLWKVLNKRSHHQTCGFFFFFFF